MDVLDVLINSPSNDPAWGFRLCEVTGYGTGTIYPALDRLLKAGGSPTAGNARGPRPDASGTDRRGPGDHVGPGGSSSSRNGSSAWR